MKLYYFAEDGNWGSADCVLLITDDWQKEDWEAIEEASDANRLNVAISINDRIKNRKGNKP